MHRRDFFLFSSSFVFLPSYQIFSKEQIASTVFNIIWRDLNIGYSKIVLEKINQTILTNIEVFISVNLLGLNLFNYKLNCKEEWRNKKLISISSNCRSNNKTFYVNGKKVKKGFKINGSAFKGIVNDDIATTSYFTPDFLRRKIWISTQDGTPYKINSNLISKEDILIFNKITDVKRFEIKGDLELDLLYNSNDEWVGCNFNAGGSKVTFTLKEKIGNINTIWNNL